MVDYKAMQNSSDEKSTIAGFIKIKLMLRGRFAVEMLSFRYRYWIFFIVSMFSKLTDKSAPK